MIYGELAVFTTLKAVGRDALEREEKSQANWRQIFRSADYVAFEGPLVPFSEMVMDVEHDSQAGILMYSNADILFNREDVRSLWMQWGGKCHELMQDDFLVTGQRIDILEDGSRRMHRPSGMDYFFFRRGMFHDLPRTLMGRGYCDSALVAYCLRCGIPVIDASFALRVEHQYHGYGHVSGGRNEVMSGGDASANKQNNNLGDYGPNVLDATHTILPDGRIVSNIRKRPKCWGLWNLITRGGRYWKNPKWDGVLPI